MEASVKAVVDFLAHEGVSKGSMNELLAAFQRSNYVLVLERAQEYARCVYSYRQDHQDVQVIVFLLTNAWETLAQYLALQYRQAHRHYSALRRNQVVKTQVGLDELEKALKHKVDLAEKCCASQKGYLLAQQWEQRVTAHQAAM